MRRKNIVVLYYTRWVYPLRDTIKSHLYCWKKYSKHNVIYINVAFGFPNQFFEQFPIDVIIFHTYFLGMRWTRSIFETYVEKCAKLKDLNCIKIAMPQDEFFNTDLLNQFINDFGVTHLLTCADAADWPIIYDEIDRNKVKIITVLTGYLDEQKVKKIARQLKKHKTRTIDIGYRAWKAEYWLGQHAVHKVRVAEEGEAIAKQYQLKADISLREEDVLNGDDWFDFLMDCRGTVGVEGGASVLDKYGKIKLIVDEFLINHPEATFEETREACFKTEDNKINLACLSPRNLEAAMTKTCQLLIEGTYNDILQPWLHYIPIKKDYSNWDEVMTIFLNPEKSKTIVDRAYQDIVLSKRWSYRKFVNEMEQAIIRAYKPRRKRMWFKSLLLTFVWNLRDKLIWQFTRLEVDILHKNEQSPFKNKLYKRALKLFE